MSTRPILSRTIYGLRLLAPYCLDAEARKCRLLREPAEHEFVQECFVNIRRQIGCLVCRRHICNRLLNPFVNRGCEKGVDFALMRPADHDCHARDLSPLVDLVTHHRVEVGTGGKHRVKSGQDVVLPDEGMGPVEVGVQRASHDLALVVDAGGESDSISLREHDTCDCSVFAVQPNPTNGCRAISTADLPNNLPAVVNGLGDRAMAEVLKYGDDAVLPRCAVSRYEAVSRVAYGLA